MDKNKFIKFMTEAGVLTFGDFVTKSGRNTPYFVNTGKYKTGSQLGLLGHYYAVLIKEVCGDNFTALFGPAYKGIPLVTTAAIALSRDYNIDKPFFFNRKEVKDHGEGGNLIGYKPLVGDTVIFIDDVITAGTALRETIPVLKSAADINLKHMFISVDRSEIGQTAGKTAVMEVKDEFDITVHSIVSIFDIYRYLKDGGAESNLLERMRDYMRRYCVVEDLAIASEIGL